VRCVDIPDQENTLSADEGAKVAASLNMNVKTAASVEDAVASISAEQVPGSPPARILICGSLYLAGHVLKNNA
jgi:dihydrofolate synthase/folylpolyglutamate synthase